MAATRCKEVGTGAFLPLCDGIVGQGKARHHLKSVVFLPPICANQHQLS